MKKFLVFAIVCSLMLAAYGCASKTETAGESVTVSDNRGYEPAPAPAPAPISPEQAYDNAYAQLPASHTVVKGECLWWIAEYQQVYNDPFMWPLIYKANRGQISDPDLIYPGQSFQIPRTGFNLDQLRADRKSAGAPWRALEPGAEARLPRDIRAQLGYALTLD